MTPRERRPLAACRPVGLTDLAVHFMNIWCLADNRIVGCRKPVASRPSTAVDVDSQREPVAGAASA